MASDIQYTFVMTNYGIVTNCNWKAPSPQEVLLQERPIQFTLSVWKNAGYKVMSYEA